MEQIVDPAAVLPILMVSPSSALCGRVEAALEGNGAIRFEQSFSRWQLAVERIRMSDREAMCLVIVDEEAGESGELNWLRLLKESASSVPVLALVDRASDFHVASMLELGVSGCIEKTFSPAHLSSAVLTAANGGIVLSPSILARVMRVGPRLGTAAKNYGLTRREKEVLRLLVDGMSIQEIAGMLSISYHTVDTHLKNMHRKFEVKNSRQIIGIALREHLLEGRD